MIFSALFMGFSFIIYTSANSMTGIDPFMLFALLPKTWYTCVGGMDMFEITLITVGKLKEKFYLSAAAEYEKRIKGYCQFKLLELPETRLPDNPSPAEISAGLEKEADLILTKIPKGAWFCTLTPEGKLLSSEALADKLQEVKLSGKSSACFLIGSSFGMAQRIKDKADFKLSMSPMTFPHHLARVMVLEQLYRAEAIQSGSKYHK